MDAAQKMVQIQDSCNSPRSDQRRSNRTHKTPLWHKDYVLDK